MAKTLEKPKKAKDKIQDLVQFAEQCPFPFALQGADGALLHCDLKEMRGLLTPGRVRKLLREHGESENEMFPVRFGACECFVLTLGADGKRLFLFLEDAVRHRDVTFHGMFLEGADCLEKWQRSAEEQGTLSPADRSRLFARTRRMREKMILASRLYSVAKRKTDEPCVCGIKGYLDLVSEKLKSVRTELDVTAEDGLTAFVPPRFLLNAVLLFTQFALLCSSEAKIEAEAKRNGKRTEICFSLPRKIPVLREIAMPAAELREEILPLLSLAMLCRENQTDFSLRDDGRYISLTLSLTSGAAEPQVFLGTRSPMEERMAESLIEEILFLNKKR